MSPVKGETEEKGGIEVRIYLAGRYERRLELCGYRSELQALGLAVVSRWLDGPGQSGSNGLSIGAAIEAQVESGNGGEASAHCAGVDLSDVRSCDLLVVFSDEPGIYNRGGKHVEFGAALAWGIPVTIIGRRENVFGWLPTVRIFGTWPEFISTLEGETTL